ncbi:hypothetical protein SAMN05192553_102169 [Cyclobacterium xiamenense]|uniref:Uncharacterized protein n=1 Tax=Cyclobacterium xiamenense TaxID=1297121 RepID=A0A1H6VME2_9BACT|nr:hypothetical protein SAMN05192553_102169 [Cyclobacterium xiamenense]
MAFRRFLSVYDSKDSTATPALICVNLSNLWCMLFFHHGFAPIFTHFLGTRIDPFFLLFICANLRNLWCNFFHHGFAQIFTDFLDTKIDLYSMRICAAILFAGRDSPSTTYQITKGGFSDYSPRQYLVPGKTGGLPEAVRWFWKLHPPQIHRYHRP